MKYAGLIAVLIALGLMTSLVTNAQTPTVTPTPDPTVEAALENIIIANDPIGYACSLFASASEIAYAATTDYGHQLEKPRSNVAGKITKAYEVTNNYPAIERSLRPLYWLYRPTSVDKSFARAMLGARQINRMCENQGKATPAVSSDILAEYGCQSDVGLTGSEVNPRFIGMYRCSDLTGYYDHTHDPYDDRTHSHSELHTHSGFYGAAQ